MIRKMYGKGGVLISTETRYSLEEKALRERMDAAITDTQTIQGAALNTEAAQINAIKAEAEILEKLLKFIKWKVL